MNALQIEKTFIGFVNFQKRFSKTYRFLIPLYVFIGCITIGGYQSLNIFGVIFYTTVLMFPTYEYVTFCRTYLCNISIIDHSFFKADYFVYNTLKQELNIPLNELRFVIQKVWWAVDNSYELIIYKHEKILVTQRAYGEWNKEKFEELLSLVESKRS